MLKFWFKLLFCATSFRKLWLEQCVAPQRSNHAFIVFSLAAGSKSVWKENIQLPFQAMEDIYVNVQGVKPVPQISAPNYPGKNDTTYRHKCVLSLFFSRIHMYFLKSLLRFKQVWEEALFRYYYCFWAPQCFPPGWTGRPWCLLWVRLPLFYPTTVFKLLVDKVNFLLLSFGFLQPLLIKTN